MEMTFGQFIREKRVASGFNLRKFCSVKGYEPSQISRMECEVVPAFESEDKLKGLAKALDISQGSEDWVEFFDLAAASRGELPKDLLTTDFKNIRQFLPAFYRTIRKDKISHQEINKLLSTIRGEGANGDSDGE